jgi:hypothetical protein
MVTITGTCSDNAKNLVAALSGNNDKSLSAKIGCYLLRVSCAAHTSQLSIIDIRNADGRIDQILGNAISLSLYIDKRDTSFRDYLNIKRPHFIATRWNSACNVLEFMVDNREAIEKFLQQCIASEDSAYRKRLTRNKERVAKGKQPKPVIEPSYPPIVVIPIDWFHLLEALKIIRSFTLRIEGDIVLQQDVFVEARNVRFTLTALEVSGNMYASTLRTAFEERFMKTADILISELAWRFTPAGVLEWRNTFSLEMNGSDEEAKKRADEHYENLSNRFVDLCEHTFDISTDAQKASYGFPALFHWWMECAPIDPGESTSSLWRKMRSKRVVIPGFHSGCPVSLSNLWKIGVALTTLPASEAICERCFSQIKHLASDLNTSMKPELFESLATIKMASYYFNKYQ